MSDTPGSEMARPIEFVPVNAIEAITRGEIDTQIATAKRFPRNIDAFRNKATAWACVDEETAGSCMYALPRAGKKIEGGSIRLAEICASCYGNLRWQGRIIGADGTHVTAMGMAYDVENNIAISIEKQRRITDRNGKRFNEDMVTVTGNAASSVAMREAIFKVIPRAYWQPIYDAARKTAIGDAETLGERRTKMLAHFAKLGVFEDRLLATLELDSTENIGPDDLAELIGTANLIREGQTTVDEAFPAPEMTKQGMRERLTKKSKPVPEPPPPPANETTTKGQAPPPIPQHLLDSQARILTHIGNLGDEAFGVLGNNGLESELELRACANPLILTKVEEEMAELAKTKGK